VRRQTVGIDPLGAKTETASTETPIASKNKGFQMLAKMGWTKGQGLGKSETAIVEPVRMRLYNFCFLSIHFPIADKPFWISSCWLLFLEGISMVGNIFSHSDDKIDSCWDIVNYS